MELVTLVCVTSLTAINSAILRHLPESIRKYWAPITQNTDEFGRRLNSNAPLIGNNDFALQPYPRAAPRTTTISHDTIAQAHVHSQGLGGDEDFLGYMGRLDRGRMDEQSAVNTSIRG